MGKPSVPWTLSWSKRIQDGSVGTCLAALLLLSVSEQRGREEPPPQKKTTDGEHNWGQFDPCSQRLALCPRMDGVGSYKQHIRGRVFAIALC